MHPRYPRAALLAGGATALSLLAAVPAPAATSHARDLTVMTRNLYLGADLIPLAVQPDLATFESAAAARFQTVLGNDFPTRAQAIATEIAKTKPDLVGLQEAAVWRRGPDGVTDGTTTPSTQVVYDAVAELTKRLRARGASYKVVVKRPWFDYEAPTSLGYDVRLTQQDVVLARTGKGARVKLGKSFTGGYSKTFDVPTQAGLARSPRGWAGVDAKLGGRGFRFVTTHLEAYSDEIANTQMKQLLGTTLASRKRQTIVVGDLNADPKDTAPNAFRTALAAGFTNPLPRRATCCFDEDLHDAGATLKTWIDHVIVRPRAKLVRSSIVGNRAADRVGGLWPSDHAGIVATLRLR
jgi:endonuclease/exonuclease/phosphatase family metal-dependent hydrolase